MDVDVDVCNVIFVSGEFCFMQFLFDNLRLIGTAEDVF